MYLFTVRHGESEWNVRRKICGMVDVSLTEKGWEQAREAGEEHGLLRGAGLGALVVQEAFPHDQHLPAQGQQFADVAGVAPRVAVELRDPPFVPRLGNRRVRAPFVAVPEAAAHLDDRPAGAQDDVRAARQRAHVQPVAVAGAVQDGADEHLRLRVLRPDPAHDPAALLLRDDVHGARPCGQQ